MDENIEQLIYDMYEGNYNREIIDEFLLMFIIFEKDENGDLFPVIKMDDIISLNLEQKENEVLIKYLQELEIKILPSSEFNENNSCSIDTYENYCSEKLKTIPSKLKKPEIDEKFMLLKKHKDNNIREQIILGNMYIVSYFAWFYSKTFSIDIDEIEQFGYEGLIFAVDHFDVLKEKDFFLYARICIKGFIKRGVCSILHSDISLNLSAHVLAYKNMLEQESGIKLEEDLTMIPKLIDLLIENDIINGKLRNEYIQALHLIYNNVSIEELLMNNEDIYCNFCVDNMVDLEKTRLMSILDVLNRREKEVISLRYGLTDGFSYTLEQIGKKRNVTKEMIRRYEKKAMEVINRSSVLKRTIDMWKDDVFSSDLSDEYMETHHVLKK